LWGALSLAAGVEEIVYRGVMVAFLLPITGNWWVAVAACIAAFTVGHVNQGWRRMIFIALLALGCHVLHRRALESANGLCWNGWRWQRFDGLGFDLDGPQVLRAGHRIHQDDADRPGADRPCEFRATGEGEIQQHLTVRRVRGPADSDDEQEPTRDGSRGTSKQREGQHLVLLVEGENGVGCQLCAGGDGPPGASGFNAVCTDSGQ
jgi:hypothetical protein